MLELLVSPRKAERKPWEMFFVGLFYASLSILLVQWIFSKDAVLADYSGVLVVTFTVIFSLPFMYFMIRLEEQKTLQHMGSFKLLKEHRKALWAFLWLFMGFVVAFSFWYIILPSAKIVEAQTKTYCAINRPGNFAECVKQYGVKASSTTVFATNKERLFLIFANNIYVLIFTLVFSLVFGAGVIFILAWNASVIAAAIGIFTQSKLSSLPIGLLRYMVHGLPEIASYFIAALAGGIISIAVIRHEFGSERFWDILQDSLDLVIVAVGVLFLSALIEVFVTPLFFS